MAAEGDGRISIEFAGAPTTAHEDYRLHVFAHGYDCQGETLKNWLFVIPDGVADDADAVQKEGAGAQGASKVDTAAADTVLNNTNLRQGNLLAAAGRPEPAKSVAACEQLCDRNPACMAWVFEAGADLCFPKNVDFCVNPSNDTCGGCGSNGDCPCTAGIKPKVIARACGRPSPSPPPPPPPGPKPTKAGRACGRMGFASETLAGPYKYCQWIEQPNPQGRFPFPFTSAVIPDTRWCPLRPAWSWRGPLQSHC